MGEIMYPDEVNTPKEKIQYIMDFYGIKDEKSNLLKTVIKDIALSLIQRYQQPYEGWIEEVYDSEFMDWVNAEN